LNSVNLCVICFVLAVQMFLASFLFGQKILRLGAGIFRAMLLPVPPFSLGI
jgi:hypothetical protein